MPELRLILGEPHETVLDDHRRFTVLNAGRGFGKTQLILARIFKHLQTKYTDKYGTPLKHKIWYLAPTYKQAKMIFWQRLKDFFYPMIAAKNEQEMTLTLVNGAEIRLVGSEQSDNLRGPYLTMAIFDEFAFHKQGYWHRIIRPMLDRVRPLGGADFFSTPDGENEFYEIFQRGQSEQHQDWSSWHYTSLEGGFIDQPEIDAAALEMTHEEHRQEYYGDFIAQAGRVYYSFDKDLHCKPVRWVKGLDIHWFWDFNEVPSCHSGLAHIEKVKGLEKVFVFDEICKGNTPQIVRDFIERYPKQDIGNIYLYGDVSGNHSTSGLTDYGTIHNILLQAGYPEPELRIATINPYEKDRVNSVNVKLRNAAGQIGMYFNEENCPKLKLDLMQVKRDDAGKIDKTTDRKLSHISDGLGYMVWRLFPVQRKHLPTEQRPERVEYMPGGFWVPA